MAVGLCISQALIYIPLPSTSGRAVLTMSPLTPLIDFLGISREITVLNYQYPSDLMDLMTPKNGTILAILVAVDIKFNRWVAYVSIS